MDKNLIADRLSRMREWDQTEPLKDILLNTFSALNEYMEGRVNELSGEIRAEAAVCREEPVLRTAVCGKADTTQHLYLFPVAAEADVPANHPGYITTIFAECAYPVIKKMISNTYKVEITTVAGTMTVDARLRYSEKYLQKLESLYHIFSLNEITWTTVNCCYFYKFLDVYYETDMAEDIVRINQIDFGEDAKYVSFDKTLLWNIEPLTETVSDVFAKSAGNAVQYEHMISGLSFDEYQYLIVMAEDRFTRFRRDNNLYIRTFSQTFEWFHLLRINDHEQDDGTLYLPGISNRKALDFANILAGGQMRSTMTRGEAERILASLGVSLKLEGVRIPAYSRENILKYEGIHYNYFADFLLPERKLLLFSFKSNEDELWVYETMFYALSELQLYFYEYSCVGELL